MTGDVTVVARLRPSTGPAEVDGSYLVKDLDECGEGLDLLLLVDISL